MTVREYNPRAVQAAYMGARILLNRIGEPPSTFLALAAMIVRVAARTYGVSYAETLATIEQLAHRMDIEPPPEPEDPSL